jgi:carbon monoxide dehydrogenase subunit G
MINLRREYTLDSSIEKVWLVLTDVHRIASCIPDVEGIILYDHGFKAIVKPRLSFIKGKFRLESSISEIKENEHLIIIHTKGSSIGSSFEIDMRIRVERLEFSTVLTVEADIETHGLFKSMPTTLIYKVIDDVEASIMKCIDRLIHDD